MCNCSYRMGNCISLRPPCSCPTCQPSFCCPPCQPSPYCSPQPFPPPIWNENQGCQCGRRDDCINLSFPKSAVFFLAGYLFSSCQCKNI